MWLSVPSTDSLTRPRIAVAVVSAIAALSVSYYAYQATQDAYGDGVPGPGLHRSNAVRRTHRRTRRANSLSSSDGGDGDHVPDENAADLDAIRPLNDGDTIVDGGTVDEWWNDPNGMQPQARAGHNIVSLLFRVSEDNARRNACVHRGCACNACGMVPIRGVRYRCANCADFDLCETCESQGVHIKTHIFYKIKVPAPPFGPRQMQPVWYTGDPEACIRNLPRSLMAKLSKETGFERPEIEAFWEQFSFMANTEWREDPDDLQLAMDKKTFERCLVPSGGSRHATPNLIHDRMFSFYDTNNDDLIGFTEFLHGLAYRKRKDKLRKIFEGYDIDGDGFVNRRDFLRMFRAYYVLYKQMHRDILDGLDDQLMGSTEAMQLVASRQPLSSLFGREGRVPRADGNNRSEGKIFHPNGDVELEPGRQGAVSEDKGDTSAREDVLTRLFAPYIGSPWTVQMRSPDSEPDTPYWDALLNPPTSMDDLPDLLSGQRRERNELDFDFELELGSSDGEEDGNNNSDAENRSSTGAVVGQPNESDNRTRRVDSEQFTSTMPTESQLRAQVINHRRQLAPDIERRRRQAARKQLHDRWKRRQFYLDEEEGGLAPDGWQSDEDVLVNNLNGVAESSKAAQQQVLSPRSRSSSKVRFAEELDDYEIRSNASASSRSIPERWGGMEIPDEERDAGKEILYQVTQQAFNELLDAIFKDKEDLAIQAAASRSQRETHRALFENLTVEETKPKATEPRQPRKALDESKPIAERSLEELLLTSGYRVEESGEGEDTHPAVEVERVIEEIDETDEEGAEEEEEEEEEVPVVIEEVEYRDPTMPQFRPNTDASIEPPIPSLTPSSLAESVKTKTRDARAASNKDREGERDRAAKEKEGILHSKLMEWKRLDIAEKEAADRGGWGKLSFEEFEDIYKSQENAGNRLDYLGSWVDFCIP
ncbi:E3 ubiquitin-protein ligase HERC2 [Colletotrichum sp. SAR 10_70]|nr:E3 ubiquitin-protein ligase HERC2 [Colletotrichum sp. SAR 10_71]KAI8166031.1 E3 ubiquitin-protein ligase HERC2 [Colletotrichum sp. SAR 10_65]KAI8174448.1 E3 ubiquitin-protein ligase HERC2 [Colletotrichum sp. SAR 10_70]KAJ4997058.1 E3 ubiquitin-protein ligase HERC2 [Colletotrichum sp. SAR 10_66]